MAPLVLSGIDAKERQKAQLHISLGQRRRNACKYMPPALKVRFNCLAIGQVCGPVPSSD